jgi:hypothetical protein
MNRFDLCRLLCELPAGAQLDSGALRAKSGAPILRETFLLPRAFHLTVDYGAGEQVCKLAIRTETPFPEGQPGAYDAEQDMQAFLLSLVPASMRGKELARSLHIVGGFSVSHMIYEHVTILTTNTVDRVETVTVQFNNGNSH